MCPCDPNSININIPDGPSGPAIPGFGLPGVPNLPIPDFKGLLGPPDLSGIFELVKVLLPVGELKSPLNPNFGKDIIDGVIKVLDQFLPFLMLYKFFLPLLKMILCVIEVICALPNPVKTANAVQRLFRECIPLFLALFPLLALIVMIIALLILIIQIIQYVILLIVQLIKLIIINIRTLFKAIDRADKEVILAVAKKIGIILCLFQNVFVVFLMISLVIQIFKDILQLGFAIPPCDSSDFQNCCTADVCPNFIKYSNFIRTTGSFQYISQVQSLPNLAGINQNDPLYSVLIGSLPQKIDRESSFRFYDQASAHAPSGEYTTEGYSAGPNSYLYQQFINMIDAKDIPEPPKPVFFPTDSNYTASTPPNQAPYLVDMKFLYNPSDWGRSVSSTNKIRHLVFKDCIITNPTESLLIQPDNSFKVNPTGVLKMAGGKGFEEDGVTVVTGYDTNASNNTTEVSAQATIENFLFIKNPPKTIFQSITDFPTVIINNIEYTFKINHSVLLSKDLITNGCMPQVNIDKTFTNAVFSNDFNTKIAQLQNLVFPDVTKAQECVFSAIDAFRNDVTESGAQQLQATAIACMQQLQQETESTINSIIPIGFDQYRSTIEINPSVQFTSKKIQVKVDLKESSGASLCGSLPSASASSLAEKIIPHVTFGDITSFSYDGSRYFIAEIGSKTAGVGELEISFDNKKISDTNIPADLSKQSSVSVRKIEYQFIYASSGVGTTSVGIGDSSDGQPRRDDGDVSREEISSGDS
jgi:hypothetical protein